MSNRDIWDQYSQQVQNECLRLREALERIRDEAPEGPIRDIVDEALED